MASLPLSLFIPSPPPSTAAFSLPSLHPIRRPTAIIFTRTMRPSRLCCWQPRSPYDFSWEIEEIEPPRRVEIFPELPPMPIPLPPPMPADPPLEHVDEDEGEEEEYFEEEEQPYKDPDEFYLDSEPDWEDWGEG